MVHENIFWLSLRYNLYCITWFCNKKPRTDHVALRNYWCRSLTWFYLSVPDCRVWSASQTPPLLQPRCSPVVRLCSQTLAPGVPQTDWSTCPTPPGCSQRKGGCTYRSHTCPQRQPHHTALCLRTPATLLTDRTVLSSVMCHHHSVMCHHHFI